MSRILLARLSRVCLFFSFGIFLSYLQLSETGTRGEESDWDVNYYRRMRELLYQGRSAHRRLDLRQQRVYSVPCCPFVRLMMCTVLFQYFACSFDMIGRFWYRVVDDW